MHNFGQLDSFVHKADNTQSVLKKYQVLPGLEYLDRYEDSLMVCSLLVPRQTRCAYTLSLHIPESHWTNLKPKELTENPILIAKALKDGGGTFPCPKHLHTPHS